MLTGPRIFIFNLRICRLSHLEENAIPFVAGFLHRSVVTTICGEKEISVESFGDILELTIYLKSAHVNHDLLSDYD